MIPKGTQGTIVECYENPEGYAVDLAIPDRKWVGGFDYENVINSHYGGLEKTMILLKYCEKALHAEAL